MMEISLPPWKAVHVGPDKLFYIKQKPDNYHLLLRIHRANPVSIPWDNSSDVLWNLLQTKQVQVFLECRLKSHQRPICSLRVVKRVKILESEDKVQNTV